MTPSAMLSDGSPSSSSSSTDMRVPRPEHSGQAPNGALNENVRGSISVSWIGCLLGQESFSENVAHACGPGLVDVVDLNQPVGEAQRRLERVGEPAEQVGAGDEPVDDDGDVVLDLLLQRRAARRAGSRRRRRRHASIRPPRAPEEVDELALLLRDDRAQHLVAGALSAAPSAGRRSAARSAAGCARRRSGQCGTPMRAQSRRM